MNDNKYDIFISYRRVGGAQYARMLKLALEKKGYKVFLDYDELLDGQFRPKIENAIKTAPIFMIIMTMGAMAGCTREEDEVRKEIDIAIREKKHIIPINPDNTSDSIPNKVPDYIKKVIENTQYSEINFGQMFTATVDLMIQNRIHPYIHRNFFDVMVSFLRFKHMIVTMLLCIAISLFIFAYKSLLNKHQDENITEKMIAELEMPEEHIGKIGLILKVCEENNININKIKITEDIYNKIENIKINNDEKDMRLIVNGMNDERLQ